VVSPALPQRLVGQLRIWSQKSWRLNATFSLQSTQETFDPDPDDLTVSAARKGREKL
jgi:hypothetical protein